MELRHSYHINSVFAQQKPSEIWILIIHWIEYDYYVKKPKKITSIMKCACVLWSYLNVELSCLTSVYSLKFKYVSQEYVLVQI